MDFQGIKKLQEQIKKLVLNTDGGYGSGNWGHVGRPGKRGGSGAGGGRMNRITTAEGKYESMASIWKAEKEYSKKRQAVMDKSAEIAKKAAETIALKNEMSSAKYSLEYEERKKKAVDDAKKAIEGLPSKDDLLARRDQITRELDAHDILKEKDERQHAVHRCPPGEERDRAREEYLEWRDSHWSEIEAATDKQNRLFAEYKQVDENLMKYQMVEHRLRANDADKVDSFLERARKDYADAEAKYNKANEEVTAMTKERNAMAAGLFNNVDDCRNPTDVGMYLQSKNYFEAGISSNGIYGISDTSQPNLTGISTDVAKDVARGYDRVMNEFPELQGKIRAPGAADLGSGVYANCGMFDGQMTVGTTLMGNKEELAKSYARCIETKWHPNYDESRYSPAEAIVCHELGHAIDGYISKAQNKNMYHNEYFSNDVVKAVKSQTKAKTYDDVKSTVSRYAQEIGRNGGRHVEFFAESICEYLTSSNPSEAAKIVGRMTHEALKEAR